MFKQSKKTSEDIRRRRWAARNMQIDRYDLRNPSHDGIATCKTAAIVRATTQGDNPFGVSHGVIGPLQSFAHVLGYRSGHEQDIGVPRRSDETDSKALDIVEGVTQSMHLQLAAIAGAGVDGATGCGQAAGRRLC
jgi:hypothetical protein